LQEIPALGLIEKSGEFFGIPVVARRVEDLLKRLGKFLQNSGKLTY